jgi:hypothetical protein
MERGGGADPSSAMEKRGGERKGGPVRAAPHGGRGERAPAVSATDRGVQPTGTGGGRPARARQGTKGGGVRSGWAVAGFLPWVGPSAQCRF